MFRCLAGFVLCFLLALMGASTVAAADCQFVLGFNTLRNLIGHDIVGDCLENEHYNEISDSVQQTTGGLMAWRKADNWTAFTDGYRTWVNGPNGLQQRLNTERFEWEADYAPGGGVATPAPVPAPTGSSIDDPIESDGLLIAADGELIGIGLTIPDGWPYILASNQFNDPPRSGNRFYIMAVSVSNEGTSALTMESYDFKLVGDRRVLYDQFDQGCGVVNDELDVELFPDGIATGFVCFEIPVDEGGLILVYEPWLSFNASRRFIRVPEGCPNQEAVGGGIVFCHYAWNEDFDFGPQFRELGLQ